MDQDEPVDGPRVAAEILKRMPSKDQARLVKAIEDSHPEIAKQIQENLFTFNDIAELTTQGLQVLIREIDHRDLVISLKRASEKVKQALFSNMSERKRKMVEDDFAALPPTHIEDVEQAQRRIIAKADELRTNGIIRSGSTKDVWI